MTLFGILNYGWMQLYTILENKYEDEAETKRKITELKLLIKRSAEASYFHQQFNDYKGRL